MEALQYSCLVACCCVVTERTIYLLNVIIVTLSLCIKASAK